MKYSYVFSTGLKVNLTKKEMEKVEKMFEAEKASVQNAIWTDHNVGMPYHTAMRKFCNHNKGLQ